MAQDVPQLRIFLSSPGDVHKEREIARELIKEALPYNPFIRGLATFDVVSWDDPHAAPGLDAHLTPQDAINKKLPKPSECDIVIVILWSRMGTPLPSEFKRDDGSTYQSGTEWEFEDGVNAAKAKGSPTTLLYQRTEKPRIDLDDPGFQEKRDQYQRVKAFFEHFRDAGGSLIGSFAAYETIEQFRVVLHQHLDSVVSGFLGQAFGEELGVTKAAVETMLAILKEQQVPPDQLNAKLREIAERHLELTEKLHDLSKSNDEPEITKRREQAAEAIELGDYDRADSLLSEAVDIDRRAIDEQQEELDRRRLSAAATIGQQGELERARLNYRRAAEHFAEASSLAPASDDHARLDYLTKQASALYDQGRDFGDKAALVEAIDINRLMLEQRTRERVPLDWAMTKNNLGIALWALGQLESGTARLEEAVDAFWAALKERTRERVPLDWASTQSNLGLALNALAARDGETARLEESVTAYKAALEECTHDRESLDWASIESNLGYTLWALGEQEGGTARLEEAVTVCNAALEKIAREREPLLWAVTQDNLGDALRTLGERESSTSRLEDAVAAYRAALEERTRERVPLDWAMTQNSLGDALRILGENENGTASLKESISAFEAALVEYTRERTPLQWAGTQRNLGLTLEALGERADRRDYLEAVKNASDVYLKEARHMHHEKYFRDRIEKIEAAIVRRLEAGSDTLGRV